MGIPEQFQTAGKEPGLQVWRVVKFELELVPANFHGQFFEGDAYILLRTITTQCFRIHTWLGGESSVDERAAAAILMTQLDDALKGLPVQFTEYQNRESTEFMANFKKGITYKRGGAASGFKHVVPNTGEGSRLLFVKGRRCIRANEVPMTWKSFTTDDSCIWDKGSIIYCWNGSKCNRFESLKAMELAIEIRNNERSGRAEIQIVEEGSEPEAFIAEFGPKPDLPFSTTADDATDKINKAIASLYLISDAAGSMKTTKVSDKNPFKQDQLSENECYILDNSTDMKIFVWKGKRANPEERSAALKAALRFIQEKNYNKDTKIQVMPDGAETALFKNFFANWVDKYETTGPNKASTMGRIARIDPIPFDASTLHSNKAMAAQHGMVDDGSGKVQIWRVEGEKVPVDKSTYGEFFGGDCYLVLYTYSLGAGDKHIIYIWQGLNCSRDELAASAFMAVQLDDSMEGVATQVRVTQGQEPAHLVSLFGGKPLIIHLGGTSRKGTPASKPASIRLFNVRESSTKLTRAVEVEPIGTSLNTNDVFLLKSEDQMIIWTGIGGTKDEKDAAKYLAEKLGGVATEVAEGKEPADFWKALGGKTCYQTSVTLRNPLRSPRLFSCSNKTGRLIAEEVPGDPTQLDLANDDIMILDTWDQIYVWIGKDANEAEKTGCLKIAEEYLASDPSGRKGTPISTIKQGAEPLSFIGWFHAWDDKMWSKSAMDRVYELLK